ncbi:MAG: LysR family transcriptional regulator [Rhodobacteraceae bacterium]|nr:LysR family transcriptional regulator [Paracoccaceae bacterium]
MAAQPPRPKAPPLTALRAFEAAGRLGGFTPAARELGVTPAAVTAHLKTLEQALGVTLFHRNPRGVTLTDLGARVLPDFTRAFRSLDAAVQRLETAAAPGLVRIATTDDLAQLWLSPRLPRLRAMGYQVTPVTGPAPDAARAVADLGLFLHEGPGMPAALIAVAAPSLAARLATPEALDPGATLVLSGQAGDWSRWLQAARRPDFRPRGPVLGSAALAIEEAANGAGVLVIARPLAEAALGLGRIEALFGIEAESGLCLSIAPLRPVEEGSAAARVWAALT